MQFEPEEALVAEEQGLFYIKETIICGEMILRPGGAAFIEMGYGQWKQALRFARKECNFKEVSVVEDLSGIKRVLVLRK